MISHTVECSLAMYRGPRVCICGRSRTPESAEVRSDQPAPSVDPDDPTLYDDMEGMTTQCSYIVHWYSCRLDAGHEGLHSPGRLPQPPAAPSLREALERLDGVFQWIREEYPKALVAMPREHYKAFANARAALVSSDPGSPSDGGLDPALIERLYRALAHDRDEDTGDLWLHRDDAADLHAFLETMRSGSPSESEG